MNVLLGISNFLVNQILSVPAFLVGIIVAIGLAALKKNSGQVLGGALKAIMGFLILSAGAGVVVTALTPLGTMILGATNAQGVVPTNEAIVSIAQEQFGGTTAYVMILGFVISLILARLTPLKYVFLTGHHVFFMATMLTVVLTTAKVNEAIVVIVGAVLLGVIMVIMPAFAHPYMKKVTGNNNVAIGHFGTLGYITAGAVGSAVGKKSKSTEDLKLPQGLNFLRDSMVATALSMVLFYAVFSVWYLLKVGNETAFAVFDPKSPAADTGAYIMKALTNGLQFGIGVAIILYGVRIILGEIVPAFQGIAKKFVPGAVPALDCPIVFPYAPNAVLVGFVFSFIGGITSLLLLATVFGPAFGLALILPGMVPHFFTGGAAGVFGNATGGRRGAILGSFANGVLITFLPALLLKVLGSLGFANTTFGDADFGWYGILIGNGVKAGGVIGIVIVLVIAIALVALAAVWQTKCVDTGWEPATAHTAFINELKEQEKVAAQAAREAKAQQ
ncbi:PTS system ascorbate-specific IIC component [Arcanobacterium pluranimalium]|uniref:PTS ascorbate transporter subunit IIC n=1 Tax=Arcanobacterium pluranimalium TaxID=108028 RepID=UPI00195E6936|nr:PTS ascorbate transporter subunit IIC [Arcanobacterium pluranimalium]MBM7825817.1 PTS system ascorbate-specific IIC component [Arcanobacterium pluranimalium]